MKKSLIDRYLSFHFSRIGYVVGGHPQLCVAAVLFVSLILGSGLLKLSVVRDTEYIFSSIEGRAKRERESVEFLFSSKGMSQDILRSSSYKHIANVIVTAKNNGSMMNQASIDELVRLDVFIRNVSFFWKNNFFSYRHVCQKNNRNECQENFISFVKNIMKNPAKLTFRYSIEKSNFGTTYPIWSLGGVSINGSGFVLNFRAVRLFYFMHYGTDEKIRMALKWDEAFRRALTQVDFDLVDVDVFTYRGMDVEGSRNSEQSQKLVFIAVAVMILFSMVSCATFDSIGSKPWVGIAALCSPSLATAAAFGLLLHCGMEYFDTNFVVAFFVIGIGLDDSFVLLAAWRRTNEEDSVKERISQTFSEAGVSITITSLTNLSSFCIGIASSYRVVRVACIYSSLSILMDFMYQIFFFGALMALDGYREKHRLNALFCYPVKRKDVENKQSETGTDRARSNNSDGAVKFLSERLGTLLGKKVTKILVVITFACIVAGSIYNMKDMKEGIELVDTLPFSSYIRKFFKVHYRYFTDYPHSVQVVFNQSLDYSNSNVQEEVESILRTFESSPYISESKHTVCWIRKYLSFIRDKKINYLMKDFNTSDSRGFVEGLKLVFLRLKPFSYFRKDIAWNSERNQIVASRCFVTSKGVRSGNDEKIMLENVRGIADRSKYRVFAYNNWFIVYEQHLNMPSLFLQNVGIAVGVVCLIFLVLIQNISYALCVTLNLVCIMVESVGYMICWEVNLDMISVMFLTMNVGICIDFSSHVAYAYNCCPDESPEGKIRVSLYAVGYPVVQGCLSTILCVVVFVFGPSYSFVVTSKVIFLVMIFAALNALILLPVILSVADSLRGFWNKKKIAISSTY
ncbi:patched domain-containing protein 3-like [Centruroides vittatus]|uniref:patched domain-containing protein 3-like n=1 Tax=Centruroides vittatus TaxID=120091 RepID=UPI00350E906B